MYKHILIPTDGSTASARAAKAGIKLAASVGARVTAFFAAPTPTPVVYDGVLPVGYMPPDQHAALIERAAAKYLGAIADLARAADVACEAVHVTSDFPADAILEFAEKRKHDLIVIAPHSKSALAELFLGSQSQKVVARAKIPVLVFR